MSKLKTIDALSQSGLSGGIAAELAGYAVADAAHRPRSNEMNISESSTNIIHASVDSAALKSRIALNSLRGQEIKAYSSTPLSAAIGIKNGLIGGIVFWILAYLHF